MARPFLADPAFARKVREDRADSINTCIGCNQACLDHIFTERTASCLVNPRAGREVEFADGPAATSRRIAVVGGGPAGMAFAVNAAERGHEVVLYEAEQVLGASQLCPHGTGQERIQRNAALFPHTPGELDVPLRLGHRASAHGI